MNLDSIPTAMYKELNGPSREECDRNDRCNKRNVVSEGLANEGSE